MVYPLKVVRGDGCISCVTEQGQRMAMLHANSMGRATLCTHCRGRAEKQARTWHNIVTYRLAQSLTEPWVSVIPQLRKL